MKKLRLVPVALLAAIALGAVGATPALAGEFTPAQWLVNGAEIFISAAMLVEGEILLRDTFLKIGVTCSFQAEGFASPTGKLVIEKFYNLGSGTATGEPLSGQALLCKNEEGCEASSTDIEVWPAKLSWLFELVLEMPSRDYFTLSGKVEYEVLCLVLNIAMSETCSAETVEGEVENETGGATWKSVAWSPLANCSGGGKEVGEIQMVMGNVIKSPGGTVTISE
jgi:hypothetical protein